MKKKIEILIKSWRNKAEKFKEEKRRDNKELIEVVKARTEAQINAYNDCANELEKLINEPDPKEKQ